MCACAHSHEQYQEHGLNYEERYQAYEEWYDGHVLHCTQNGTKPERKVRYVAGYHAITCSKTLSAQMRELDKLKAQGVSVIHSNRGGDITYHGPGQIVGYPIISLQERRDLHAYLRDLEQVVIRTLATFGLETARRDGKTGIWLGERKICAIGVAVRTWVTYHGFALNVNPDMSHFTGIVPCGITDGTVTSMQAELGETIDLGIVKARLAVEFQKVFRNTAAPL